MHNILSVDTSSEETSCCIVSGDGSSLKFEHNKQSHAESLFKLIGEAVDERSIKITDISHFVVSIGPGSYTGVRIGLSAVKGIAFANGAPVIGVSKFDVLAHKANITGEDFLVCFDAKRDEVFCQKFHNENGEIKKLSKPYILSVAELNDVQQKKVGLSSESAIFNGDFIAIDKVDAKDIADYASVIIGKGTANDFPAAPLYIRNVDYVKVTNLRS